jgi:PAS domain S-box-containing protein
VHWGDALFEALVDTSDDAIFCQDQAGRIARWNRSAERIFGFPAGEVIGKRPASLFPEHLRPEFETIFSTVLAGDQLKQFESEILRRDGMPVPISLSMCPVLDDDEQPVASVAIARDITEQRLAQATLAEIETRVRESEAMAHVGSWLWDVRTGTVQWSDEFHRIHGVDPLDFDGTFEAHLARIHADDRDRVEQALQDAVDGTRAFEAEYRVVRPDGTVRFLHARAQPTIGSAGAVMGLRGIGQDVTERH